MMVLANFQTSKDLRQGDPFSPMIFNIVVDMLVVVIVRAKEDGQVGSLMPHLVEGGFLSCIMQMIQYCSWNIILKRPEI
jgi:hypothetical protein